MTRGAAEFEAVVVGTIHKFHLVERGYPLVQLAALVDGYHPDLVLVEIRPGPFRQARYEDGPLEMSYVTWVAQQKRIAVEPIDWFRDEDVGREEAPDTDLKQAYEVEVREAAARMKWPLSFTQVHSAQQDASLLLGLNLQARYLRGNGSWNQRQAWFHWQALRAIRKHGARRVMAFVGAYHRPELESFLAGQGGSIRDPKTVAARLPAKPSTRVPDQVVRLWRDGILRLEREAARATGKLAEALRSKVLYFKVAADRGGECCVDPITLQSAPP